MTPLQQFNEFLSGIDLGEYRKRYNPIKLVELDMDRNVQAIRHIYREYWDDRTHFPDYEQFYRIYSSELAAELKQFRERKMFSEETFCRGLPARIYRTWASLLTQIQGGYVAEAIYGYGKVEMSADLDYQGIDMCIHTPGEVLNIQVKKESLSREVRAPWPSTRHGKPIINIIYEVPGCDPLTPTGKPCAPFHRWQEKWTGKLARLDNGFIIFTEGMFLPDYIGKL